MAQLDKEDAEALEALIDKCGLSTVVSALALIASEKAEHVRANWNDRALAKAWDKCAAILNTAEAKVAGEEPAG